MGVKPVPNNGTLHLPLYPAGLHSDADAPALDVPNDPPVSSSNVSSSTSRGISTTSTTPAWTRPAPVHTTASTITTGPGVSQSIGNGPENNGNGKDDDDHGDEKSWLDYLKDKIDALKAWAKALLKDKESNTDPSTDQSQ